MSVRNLKKKSRTDWDRIDRMTDDEIDTSDIPPLTDEFFERARRVLPRAYIDRLDFIEAGRFAAHILDKGWPAETDELAHKAFHTALIMFYARPFTGRHYLEEHGEAPLDERIAEVLSEEEIKLHERVKILADRWYAHSDTRSHLFEELDSIKKGLPSKGSLPLEKGDIKLLVRMIKKWINYLEARASVLKQLRRQIT